MPATPASARGSDRKIIAAAHAESKTMATARITSTTPAPEARHPDPRGVHEVHRAARGLHGERPAVLLGGGQERQGALARLRGRRGAGDSRGGHGLRFGVGGGDDLPVAAPGARRGGGHLLGDQARIHPGSGGRRDPGGGAGGESVDSAGGRGTGTSEGRKDGKSEGRKDGRTEG